MRRGKSSSSLTKGMTTIKKVSAVLAVLVFMPSLVFATAITEISLGPASGIIKFTGKETLDPTDLSITLGSCGKRANCVLAGRAIGTGKAALPGNKPAPYTILTSKSDVITASDPSSVPGEWTITQSAPEAFNWGKNGSLLTGTFDLISLFQAPGSSVAVFNDEGIFNMVITGGSETFAFGGPSASIDLIVKFQSTTDLGKLLGTEKSVMTSRLSSGEILPTPEAGTLALMGAGLMGIAGLIRRRRLGLGK